MMVITHEPPDGNALNVEHRNDDQAAKIAASRIQGELAHSLQCEPSRRAMSGSFTRQRARPREDEDSAVNRQRERHAELFLIKGTSVTHRSCRGDCDGGVDEPLVSVERLPCEELRRPFPSRAAAHARFDVSIEHVLTSDKMN